MKFADLFNFCSRHNAVHQAENDSDFHEQQLNQNLKNYNIHRVRVKGDGNCLFYALAEGLIYEMKMDPNVFCLKLEEFGLSLNISSREFADRLRKLCVDEWKSKEQFYSQFVNTEQISFLKEVKKFSKSGVSDSTLGDIVPLTISNILNIEIVIFTSVSNLSRIDVKPESRHDMSSLPQKIIYLAYNQCGVGHYDAAYPRS